MKRTILSCLLFLFSFSLFGCGKTDVALDQYKEEMSAFTQDVTQLVEQIEQIDPDSETRTQELLQYLDEMDEAFQIMSELNVPKQFSNNEDLAKEASMYLSESVSLYHQAFDNPEFYDENLVDAALENYERAFKRLEYISIILQGDLPEDETITIVSETEEENP